MTDYPFCDLTPAGFAFRPVLNGRSGPAPISGPSQVGNYAAGFHWICEYQAVNIAGGIALEDWLGLLAGLLSSSPVLNVRYPQRARTLAMTVTLAADAALNATSVSLHSAAGPAPRAGQAFSMIGASGISRLHLISSAVSTGGGNYACGIVPDLREDYLTGETAEFTSPVLSMNLAGGAEADAFPQLAFPLLASGSIRFEEYWPCPD